MSGKARSGEGRASGADRRDDADARVGWDAWDARAEAAQRGLARSFGSPFARMGFRNGSRPLTVRPFTFNYWWFAHLIELRVDAFERSGDARWLDEAERMLARLRRRNGGRLENDYFDDMGWLTIALLRLFEASKNTVHLDEARSLHAEIRRTGWNDVEGPSVSWRRSQPDYKNAPSTGTFAIASAVLARVTDDPAPLADAEAATAWLTERLLLPSGLVADGVNRQGDGRVDTDWTFSYDQGLYIGALVSLHEAGGSSSLLDRAARTAEAAERHLAPTGVITSENAVLSRPGGADVGLFKGVLLRYAARLAESGGAASGAGASSAAARAAAGGADAGGADAAARLVRASTDRLRAALERSDGGRVGDDWSKPAPPVTALSTQLSAVMALEARARLERALYG